MVATVQLDSHKVAAHLQGYCEPRWVKLEPNASKIILVILYHISNFAMKGLYCKSPGNRKKPSTNK